MRRRPELNRGYRPPVGARFASGRCRVCGDPYLLDRQVSPWARARTCSARCAKVMANHDRHPGNCAHCADVRDWQLQQDADIRSIEVAAQDEDARPMTFGDWLEHRAVERCAEREQADRCLVHPPPPAKSGRRSSPGVSPARCRSERSAWL